MDVVKQYEDAVKQKQTIEEEIDAVVGELTSGANPPGVKGSLIDAEGFPRADIDVYRVRQQRHRLACLQTDHKAVMATIENLLPEVFAAKSGKAQVEDVKMQEPIVETNAKDVSTSKPQLIEPTPEETQLQAFAVVDSVQHESPADIAGLQAQDQVLKFGTADASNHRELAAIRDIVQSNIGSSIRVVVRRQQEVVALELTPQSWRGPGVLGCLLLPL